MYGENRARRVKKSLGSKYKELIPKKVNLKKKEFQWFRLMTSWTHIISSADEAFIAWPDHNNPLFFGALKFVRVFWG